MLAVPATEDKVKLMVLSVRKRESLAPNAIYRGLFREKKKMLPIKRPVCWFELADDLLVCFPISEGLV